MSGYEGDMELARKAISSQGAERAQEEVVEIMDYVLGAVYGSLIDGYLTFFDRGR